MTNTVAIVAAIYLIEGGQNAVPPYGIMPLRDEWRRARTTAERVEIQARCREWCEALVVSRRVAWRDAGAPGCFYDFLADRYCPASTDPTGNRNWKRNIKSRLRHQTCDCWKDRRKFSVR